MAKGRFQFKLKFENIPIIDGEFNKLEDLELTMKDIKKKFG